MFLFWLYFSRRGDMRKYVFLCSFVVCYVAVLAIYDKIVSKGKWVVERIDRCADHESYSYDVDLHKKKMNRTHDVFYGAVGLTEDLTEEDFAISIVACKKVDGGCKIVNTMNDESFCRFVVKYAEENFKTMLKSFGLEEHCPIPKGSYKLEDFIFDNTELPEDGMVGRFVATIKVVKKKEKIACVVIHLHFDEDEE